MSTRSMAAIAAIATAAGVASAGFTTVNTHSNSAAGLFGGTSSFGKTGSGSGNELSVVEIMSQMFRGTTDLTSNVSGDIGSTLSFINGSSTITATRVLDFGGANPLNLGSGAGATQQDQIWQDGTVTFQARARYAGYDQNLGLATYNSQTNSLGAVTGLVTGIGQGFVNSTSAPIFLGSPVDFVWVRDNNSAFNSSNTQYSLQSLNTNSADQMVTWQIDDGTGRKRYVIAFEDIEGGDNPRFGDRDFNDLVIDLVVIPLPHASGMALAGLGILGLRRRRA